MLHCTETPELFPDTSTFVHFDTGTNMLQAFLFIADKFCYKEKCGLEL